jgi:hypothetical protein
MSLPPSARPAEHGDALPAEGGAGERLARPRDVEGKVHRVDPKFAS